MIERTVQAVLLDIEGTTSSIAFVYDVMFPYVRKHVRPFLDKNLTCYDVGAAVEQMAIDGLKAVDSACPLRGNGNDSPEAVAMHVLELMDRDSKATGLKALQGLIWEAGFQSGELRSHLFDDCFPALERWKADGLTLAIYSSGSVVAQKLFFGHTEHGDLRPYFTAHFDTTIGPKRETVSYLRIASELGIAPESILFLSDVSAEIDSALAAELQSIAVVRPGNAPLPDGFAAERISTFHELKLLRN